MSPYQNTFSSVVYKESVLLTQLLPSCYNLLLHSRWCSDPVGAAGADPAAGRADAAVAGAAGSGPTDYYSAAPDSHYCRTEPGQTFTIFSYEIMLCYKISGHRKMYWNVRYVCVTGPADYSPGPTGCSDCWRPDHCVPACECRWHCATTGYVLSLIQCVCLCLCTHASVCPNCWSYLNFI